MKNKKAAKKLAGLAMMLCAADDYRDTYKLDDLEEIIEDKLGGKLKFYYVKNNNYLEMNTSDFSKKTGLARHFIRAINLNCNINLKNDPTRGNVYTSVRFDYTHLNGSNEHTFLNMVFDGRNWRIR